MSLVCVMMFALLGKGFGIYFGGRSARIAVHQNKSDCRRPKNVARAALIHQDQQNSPHRYQRCHLKNANNSCEHLAIKCVGDGMSAARQIRIPVMGLQLENTYFAKWVERRRLESRRRFLPGCFGSTCTACFPAACILDITELRTQAQR